MAEKSGKTFFSYAREDSAFVLQLVKELRAAGADVWLDQLDIGPGQHWDAEVEKALGLCSRHVTVLSPASISSQNVMDEVSYALEERKQIIPLLYRNCPVPFRLRRLQWVDFRTDYANGFKELAQALGIRNAPAAPAPPSAEPVSAIQRPLEREMQTAAAAQPAPAAEQPPPTITIRETRGQEDYRRTAAGHAVAGGQRVGPRPGILWGLGAGLIILVIIIWAISSNKAPGNSGGVQLVEPTATPVSSSTPNNSQDEANDAQAFYQRGEDLYKKKQYNQAIDAFTQAIRLKPDYTEAYSERGAAYDDKGDYNQAIQDYTQALKLNPNDGAVYNNRGISYHNKGDNDRAIQDYNRAFKLNWNHAEVYNNRGTSYYSQGYYDLAIQDYTEALKLKPNYAFAYNNRGVAYDDKGDHDRAIQDFDQALMLNPKYANAYNNRGTAYESKKQYVQALQDFDSALKIDPNMKSAQQNRDRVAAKFKAQAGP